jgi:hypothetical protein
MRYTSLILALCLVTIPAILSQTAEPGTTDTTTTTDNAGTTTTVTTNTT